jgi:AraC family transcriptional regulator
MACSSSTAVWAVKSGALMASHGWLDASAEVRLGFEVGGGSKLDNCRASLDHAPLTRRWDLALGSVENLTCNCDPLINRAQRFAPNFQVVLPYRGIVVWHIGGDDVVGDANQVLFVTGGEQLEVISATGAYGALIITPDPRVLCRLLRMERLELQRHLLFERRSWPASPHLQAVRAQFLHWATRAAHVDALEAEEQVLVLLRSAFHIVSEQAAPCGPSTGRLIRRAKEFLQAEQANAIRLVDVAHAVNASPTYLTHIFRRVEGTSLHRYLTRLRLARALDELPHAPDLTQLALELGFSSHSHFTARFRHAFGCTPSEFRATARSLARLSVA